MEHEHTDIDDVIYTLEYTDGRTEECGALTTFHVKSHDYIALATLDENGDFPDELDVTLMRCTLTPEQTASRFEEITDPKEIALVQAAFEEIIHSDDE